MVFSLTRTSAVSAVIFNLHPALQNILMSEAAVTRKIELEIL